jgi:hypothetical protein
MSEDFDPNFDREWHTDDEIRAHHWARYEADPGYKAEMEVLAAVAETLDDTVRAAIAEVDPIGAAMFGERWRGGVDDDGNPPQVDPHRWLDEHMPGESGA